MGAVGRRLALRLRAVEVGSDFCAVFEVDVDGVCGDDFDTFDQLAYRLIVIFHGVVSHPLDDRCHFFDTAGSHFKFTLGTAFGFQLILDGVHFGEELLELGIEVTVLSFFAVHAGEVVDFGLEGFQPFLFFEDSGHILSALIQFDVSADTVDVRILHTYR